VIELTLKQKIKVLDIMIKELQAGSYMFLCHRYTEAIKELFRYNYKKLEAIDNQRGWTPGFKELDIAIRKALGEVGCYIEYQRPRASRLALLRRIRNKL